VEMVQSGQTKLGVKTVSVKAMGAEGPKQWGYYSYELVRARGERKPGKNYLEFELGRPEK